MKKETARIEIMRVWQTLSEEDRRSIHSGMILYTYLQENRPDLLSFRCSGDPYQVINGWVMSWRRLNTRS